MDKQQISEAKIQSTVMTWLWNEKPQTRGCFWSVTNSGAKISPKKVKEFLFHIKENFRDRKYCEDIIDVFVKEISKGNSVSGALDKALGLVPGVADVNGLWERQFYAVEFKTETGKQSPRQEWWQKEIEKQGGIYVLVRSIEEGKEFFNGIIK